MAIVKGEILEMNSFFLNSVAWANRISEFALLDKKFLIARGEASLKAEEMTPLAPFKGRIPLMMLMDYLR